MLMGSKSIHSFVCLFFSRAPLVMIKNMECLTKY